MAVRETLQLLHSGSPGAAAPGAAAATAGAAGAAAGASTPAADPAAAGASPAAAGRFAGGRGGRLGRPAATLPRARAPRYGVPAPMPNGVGGKRPPADSGGDGGSPPAKRARAGSDGAAAGAEALAQLMDYGSDSEPARAPRAAKRQMRARPCPLTRQQAQQARPARPGARHWVRTMLRRWGTAPQRGRGQGQGWRGAAAGAGGPGAVRPTALGGAARGSGAAGAGAARAGGGTLTSSAAPPHAAAEAAGARHPARAQPLLQALRFFAANDFLRDPAAVRFPEDGPPAPSLREQLLGPGALPPRGCPKGLLPASTCVAVDASSPGTGVRMPETDALPRSFTKQCSARPLVLGSELGYGAGVQGSPPW